MATKIALEISLHEASDGPVILAAAAELLKFINATPGTNVALLAELDDLPCGGRR